MTELYEALQEHEMKAIIMPKDFTIAEIYAVALLKCCQFDLVKIIRTNDPTPYIKDNIVEKHVILLDIGGGEFDSLSDQKFRSDRSPVTCLSLLWDNLKENFPEDIASSFYREIIVDVERYGILAKYITKILKDGTETSFTMAVNAAFRILKIWLIK